jgi:hypothetical protein
MEKDFHYYCLGVLARASGFAPEEALTIAYASQYVDDCTESEPIKIGDMTFDPVRTSHYRLMSYGWSIQKRVLIPFHFLPPGPIQSPEAPFVTRPNSPLALQILREASDEAHSRRRLCRLGVAFHTLSDAWAHEGFSGRQHEENDVENIYHKKGRKWKHLLLDNFLLDVLPQVGHAEAGYFPDQPFLYWKYTRRMMNKEIKRNNTNIFLSAAKSIYDLLLNIDKSASDTPIAWESLKKRIRVLLAYKEEDVEKRCARWKKTFEKLFKPLDFEYDKQTWRDEALHPLRATDTDWDHLAPSDFKHLQFPLIPGFFESKWVHFHKAALRQRHLVLENLF